MNEGLFSSKFRKDPELKKFLRVLSNRYRGLEEYLHQSTRDAIVVPSQTVDKIINVILNFKNERDEEHNPFRTCASGNTSIIKLISGSTFVKLDSPQRLAHEARVYQCIRKTNFRSLTPSFLGFSDNSDSISESAFAGFLFLENLDTKNEVYGGNQFEESTEDQGGERIECKYLSPFQQKVKEAQRRLLESQSYRRISPVLQEERKKNLFYLVLMAYFHSEMSPFHTEFDRCPYGKLNGDSHVVESRIPHHLNNRSGEGYRRYKETCLDDSLTGKDSILNQIIERYLEGQKRSRTIVHGDFKIQNVPKGYLVDFSQTGKGFETDDLTYFLICNNIESLPEMNWYLDRYSSIRKEFDPVYEHRLTRDYHEFLTELLPYSVLVNLVLKHSVMEKRDLTRTKYYLERRKYKQQIEFMCSQSDVYGMSTLSPKFPTSETSENL